MSKHIRRRNGLKQKTDGTKKLLIAVICVLIAVVIALVVIFIVLPAIKGGGVAGASVFSDWFDPQAEEGSLPGRTPEEIQAELNRIVEEGMFNISIASIVVFEDGEAEGQIRIENIKANPYNMSVEITLDDTGETVYKSKGLAPGQYIEYIRLDKALPKGEYSATAVFTAHDTEDFSEVGQAAAKITLVVEN